MPIIAAEPFRSVRLLTIWKARLTEQTGDAIKRFAAHNTPYILASAVVGVAGFQAAVLILRIKSNGRDNLEIFQDEQQAKNWLAAR